MMATAKGEVIMERKNNYQDNTTINLSDKVQMIFWANIWDTVSQINRMTSIEEFYGNVVPVNWGNEQVYERLQGWRREAYKHYLMSGYFIISRFGEKPYLDSWGYGRFRPNRDVAVVVRQYKESATDWMDYTEVHEEWTWEEVCKYL
jgi:hypothetical protein